MKFKKIKSDECEWCGVMDKSKVQYWQITCDADCYHVICDVCKEYYFKGR